ncbi:hypothetical protein [Maribacter sp. HTCC2170]|uniref:hypothetical protein n=1 Tax=Maribacter sp. (strain HTCC2170 / KCCM 42371) TaxID=313603 RepID=UPI00006BD39E|nr:hypothetical protein [Maribacter sp. HTCC2170]EAR02770.1 hypothetical protein FB2170_05765 [Maribacter sp. HTCC2170]
MNKKALVIIESPLQLINSNEYLKAHAVDYEVDYYLISSREVNNLNQIKDTFSTLELCGNVKIISVQDINKSFITRLKFYKKVIHSARSNLKNKYDLVLVGHIASIYQAIMANSTKGAHCIYLDDGTAAFHEHQVLKKKKIKSFSSIYKRIFPTLVGLNANIKTNNDRISFFTMYRELMENDHPYLEYKYNSFNYLKKEYTKKDIDANTVYFIGTPFYWNSESYNKAEHIFEQVAVSYHDKKVVYFPHRYESQEHKLIVKKHGWQIIEPGIPIELSLMKMSYLPVEFGMFTSSAYYTILKLIPNIQFRSFEISNLKHIFNGHNTYKLYREYDKSENVKIIKLE